MKTIGSIKDLLTLTSELSMLIIAECPWMAEQWDPEDIGYVFVLDDSDINKVTSVYTIPHIQDDDYRQAMTIDLETFDLWETPAIYDDSTGYWNVTAIFGGEFGCTLFLSSGFVASIPALRKRLNDIRKVR